jgi:hypothetical protein
MGFDATGEVKRVGGEFDGVGVEDIADVAEDVVGPQGRGKAQGVGYSTRQYALKVMLSTTRSV